MIQQKYASILHPLLADKKLIDDNWQQNWLGSMAGKGLEYLQQEILLTAWIPNPVCNSRRYFDLVKLMSQTLPCQGQQFNIDKNCRMGCPEQETILHIFQKGPGTHYPQI